MQMLKMISSLVFLARPLRNISSMLLVRPVGAIIRGVRPATALIRACYVMLGLVLLLGAWGAEQAGQRNYAIILAAVGATLLILRRLAATLPLQNEPRASTSQPSDLLKLGWSKKRLAVDGNGDLVLPNDPTAIAWSLCGALNAVFESDSDEWRAYLVALQSAAHYDDLVRWNKDFCRTQQEAVDVAMKVERLLQGDKHSDIVDKHGEKPGQTPGEMVRCTA